MEPKSESKILRMSIFQELFGSLSHFSKIESALNRFKHVSSKTKQNLETMQIDIPDFSLEKLI